MNPIERNRVHRIGQQGPVLLYAHGFGCHQGMWAGITPAFQGSYQQVLMDYTGSGPSQASIPFDARRYSRLEGYAQDLIEVCDALDVSAGVTLVAHSVSCSIGLLAHLERPGLFERLILIGPSPCFLNHPPDYLGGFERADLEGLLDLMDQNYLGWASYLAPVVAGESGANDARADLESSFCSTDPETARVFARATFFADNRAELPKVHCPSLILQHARDALAPQAVGEYLHRQLAGSRYELLDVSGHCAHMSHPALVIDAMRRYLATGGAAR